MKVHVSICGKVARKRDAMMKCTTKLLSDRNFLPKYYACFFFLLRTNDNFFVYLYITTTAEDFFSKCQIDFIYV